MSTAAFNSRGRPPIETVSAGTETLLASRILRGTGTPEGVVVADIGSLFEQIDATNRSAILQKVSGTGNTGWRRIKVDDEILDVSLYDGISDPTESVRNAAFQQAITDTIAAAGLLYVPDGTYQVRNLTIGGSMGMALGKNAVLQLPAAAGTGDALVQVNTATPTGTIADVTITGGTFDGNGAGGVVHVTGVRAYQFHNLRISGVQFKSFYAASFPNPSYCIYARGNPTVTPTSPFPWDTYPTTPAGFSSGLLVEDCYFTDCANGTELGAEPVFVYQVDGARISRSYVSGAVKGFYAQGWCRGLLIDSCLVENTSDNGIRVNPNEDGSGRIEDMINVTISNSIVRYANVDGYRVNGYRCNLINVQAYNCVNSGFKSDYSKNLTVIGGQFHKNGNVGAYLAQNTLAGYGSHEGAYLAHIQATYNAGKGILAQGGGDPDTGNVTPLKRVRFAHCYAGFNGFEGLAMYDADSTCSIDDCDAEANCQAISGGGAGLAIVAVTSTVVGVGGVRVTRNRAFDRTASPTQWIGIQLTAGGGATLARCYVLHNDCSDTPDVGANLGAAILTSSGLGTMAGHVLQDNWGRNVSRPPTAASIGGVLRAVDLIDQLDETTGTRSVPQLAAQNSLSVGFDGTGSWRADVRGTGSTATGGAVHRLWNTDNTSTGEKAIGWYSQARVGAGYWQTTRYPVASLIGTLIGYVTDAVVNYTDNGYSTAVAPTPDWLGWAWAYYTGSAYTFAAKLAPAGHLTTTGAVLALGGLSVGSSTLPSSFLATIYGTGATGAQGAVLRLWNQDDTSTATKAVGLYQQARSGSGYWQITRLHPASLIGTAQGYVADCVVNYSDNSYSTAVAPTSEWLGWRWLWYNGSGYTVAMTLTKAGVLTGVQIDASTITGKLGEVHGGTNQSTYTLGDLLYASAANTLSRLAGNTTAVRTFLRQTGTGSVSAAPAWDTLIAGDIPSLDPGKIVGGGSFGTGDYAFPAHLSVVGSFGANGAVPQPAYASGGAVATTASTNSSPYGFTTQAQADGLVTLVNNIRTALVNNGIMS